MCSLQLSSEKPGLIPTPNNSKLIYYMPPNIKIPLVSTVAMALAMAPLSRADCRDNKSCPPATELGMGAPCEGGSWYLVASQWSPPFGDCYQLTCYYSTNGCAQPQNIEVYDNCCC
jgi:hypothetical protein